MKMANERKIPHKYHEHVCSRVMKIKFAFVVKHCVCLRALSSRFCGRWECKQKKRETCHDPQLELKNVYGELSTLC